jgi:ubiquinone/menaquinone biosynthesis C-methylase UbiE
MEWNKFLKEFARVSKKGRRVVCVSVDGAGVWASRIVEHPLFGSVDLFRGITLTGQVSVAAVTMVWA